MDTADAHAGSAPLRKNRGKLKAAERKRELGVAATKIKRWIKDNVEVRYLFEPAPKPGKGDKSGEKMVRVNIGWGSRRKMPDDGGKNLLLTVAGGIAVTLLISLVVAIVDAIRNLP